MPEQIFDYLIITLCLFGLAMFAIAFFNQANQEAEIELNIFDKFELKLRTKKSDANKDHFFNTATDDEWIAAFSEWSQSHQSKNLPVLSEEAMSRDSISDEQS